MKINKYHITIVIILLLGGFILHQLISSYQELEQKKIQDKLEKTHSDAILRARAGIDVYATIVSSFKSHLKNSSTFPSEVELQSYLNDLLNEIKFNDSIVVNYIDKDHIFKYVISPQAIDASHLKGVSAEDFVDQERINELNALMTQDNIKLFSPINLREGWVGFPFNFSVKDKDDRLLGYVALIINSKYLLDYFYEDEDYNEFAHKFTVMDSIDLTREVIYDGSDIFNKNVDAEYYKNFNIDPDAFIYSTIDVFNLNLRIGSAFKKKPKNYNVIAYIGYLWYFIISSLVFIIYRQYSKNKKLNRNLNIANEEINSKNTELEKSLDKIQTLIKEIHHRVKNNMQMIAGILTLQQDESDDVKVKSALEQSKSRIHSMALVHEKLYGSDSLKDIKIKEYTEQLLDFVEKTVGNKDLAKTIAIDENLIFDGDTTSNLGLIINELMTNTFKHAFKGDNGNAIDISIIKESEAYKLVYSDNGPGLPEHYNLETSESLGMQLIFILADQLNGEVMYSNEGKSTFTIYFKPIEQSFSE